MKPTLITLLILAAASIAWSRGPARQTNPVQGKAAPAAQAAAQDSPATADAERGHGQCRRARNGAGRQEGQGQGDARQVRQGRRWGGPGRDGEGRGFRRGHLRDEAPRQGGREQNNKPAA